MIIAFLDFGELRINSWHRAPLNWDLSAYLIISLFFSWYWPRMSCLLGIDLMPNNKGSCLNLKWLTQPLDLWEYQCILKWLICCILSILKIIPCTGWLFFRSFSRDICGWREAFIRIYSKILIFSYCSGLCNIWSAPV